jgi:hypothetical protein
LRKNFLLKHVTEGKIEGTIEVTGRQERSRKQLLDNLEGTTEYCKLKEETLARTLRKTDFGRGYEPVARQTTE